MTEARGLFYTFAIVFGVTIAATVGLLAARQAIWGCGSYAIETKPDGEIWACYIADGKCELICAPLEPVLRALQRKQLENTI